jgi:hypothetical protein
MGTGDGYGTLGTLSGTSPCPASATRTHKVLIYSHFPSQSVSGASRDRTGDLLLAKPWLDAQNPVVTAILIDEHPGFRGFSVEFDDQSDDQKS